MPLISTEEAKTRLAEFNILLKYMSFLQNNGLSDCGKGQIIGQASLLEEYLKEREGNADKSHHNEQKEQIIVKDVDKVGKTIQALQENATNDNTSRSGLLRQMESLIDKTTSRDITVEDNRSKTNEQNGRARQMLTQRMNDNTIDCRQQQHHHIGGVRADKETDESWINKIKKVTEIENWG